MLNHLKVLQNLYNHNAHKLHYSKYPRYNHLLNVFSFLSTIQRYGKNLTYTNLITYKKTKNASKKGRHQNGNKKTLAAESAQSRPEGPHPQYYFKNYCQYKYNHLSKTPAISYFLVIFRLFLLFYL